MIKNLIIAVILLGDDPLIALKPVFPILVDDLLSGKGLLED